MKRKQIADALERSEQMFRAISTAAVNAIIVMDNDGNISYWNPAARKIFGYTSEEAIGRELHTFLAPHKYHDPYIRGFRRFRKTGEGIAVGGPSEFTALKKDRTEFPIEVSTSSVLIGGKWHAVGIVRDITERKRSEAELKKSHDTLRALSLYITELEEAEKRRLARELHDLVGQKLTTLSINLDFLVRRLSEESKKSIGPMLQDSKVLVKDIMKLIRDVMSNLRPHILDDYGLTAAIYWYIEQYTKRTKIPVIFKQRELKKRLLPDIETNLFRITQEALTNIAKYAHASMVTITIKERNGTVNLSIADNGIGFNPENIQQLAEKKGLGLIGMRERAESIGGRLYMNSAVGKGTTISVVVKK
jgi:PAS domain S-box-containing protein